MSGFSKVVADLFILLAVGKCTELHLHFEPVFTYVEQIVYIHRKYLFTSKYSHPCYLYIFTLMFFFIVEHYKKNLPINA